MAEEQVIGTARVDIVVDADGVEVATKKAKESISSMSREAQQEYSKLTASQKRQVEGLLRNADQLGMTRSEQVAYNATLKTSGALHEEITKRIRAHEAAQVSDSAALDMGYRSHKQLQAAMRGTPAQISDIVVSLQGGQRPMTVFLQQGLQLRDMFGSWKQVAAGMGSALVGMINPVTMAAAAVGALFAAWQVGQKEAQAFNKSIVMSGNAAGLSAGELQTMARQVGEITGTQREASAVLVQMAGSANIAKEGMAGYAETAINLNRLVGKSVEETIADFESLGKSPVEASQKLNQQYGYLTFAVYEQIKALQAQGRADEAAELAQQTYKSAMDERTASLESNLGVLEKAWAGVGGAASKAWDYMLNIGREASLEDQIQAQIKTIENLQKVYDGYNYKDKGPAQAALAQLEAAKATLEALTQNKAQQDEINESTAEAARLSKEKIAAEAAWAAIVAGNLSTEEKQREQINKIRETGLALGKSEKDIQTEINALLARSQPKAGGGGLSAGESELANIRARIAAQDELLVRLRAHGTETQKLTEGERAVLKLQEDLTGKLNARQRATKELALEEAKRWVQKEKEYAEEKKQQDREQEKLQAIDDERKARQEQIKEVLRQSEEMDKSNTTLKEEIELIGKTRQEQAKIIIGRHKERLAVEELHLAELKRVADAGESTTMELYAQEQKTEKLREYIALLEDKDFAEANAEAAAEIASQWEKTAETIGSTLQDYIMGGGKDAAQYLKRLFSTLVLQPIVQMGAKGLTDMISGFFSQGGGGSGGGGTSGILGAAGSFGPWAALIAMGMNMAGKAYDEGHRLSHREYAAAWMATGGIAPPTISIDTKLLSGIVGGRIANIITGASLWGKYWNKIDGSGDPHVGATGHFQTGFGSENYASGVTKYDGGIGEMVQDLAGALGESFEAFMASFDIANRVDVTTSWADDFDGEGGSWGSLIIRFQDAMGEWVDVVDWSAGQWDSKWSPREFDPMEEGWDQYVEAVMQGYVDALQTLDLPAWASDVLDSIADDASLEEINAQLAQLGLMREAITSWTENLVEFSSVGDDAFSALIESMGGFANLSTGVASFVELYYSDAEKVGMAQKQLTEALAEFDLELPALDVNKEAMDSAEEVKAAWRAMVSSALEAGEEGADLAALLLSLGPAFAQYAEGAESLAQAEAELAKQRAEEHQAQIDEWMNLGGLSVQSMSQGFLDALKNGDDPGAWLADHITSGFEQAMQMQALNMVMQRIMDEALAPAMEEVMTDLFGERGESTATTAEDAVMMIFDRMDAAFEAVTGASAVDLAEVASGQPIARDKLGGGLPILDVDENGGQFSEAFAGMLATLTPALESFVSELGLASAEAIEGADFSETSAAINQVLGGIVSEENISAFAELFSGLPELDPEAAAAATALVQQALDAALGGINQGALGLVDASVFANGAFDGMADNLVASSAAMLDASAQASSVAAHAAVNEANAAISTVASAKDKALSMLADFQNSDIYKELFGSYKPKATVNTLNGAGGVYHLAQGTSSLLPVGDARSQADSLVAAWKSVYDVILGSMTDLRDTILGTTEDEGNSFYEAQFAMLTAQARAGDQEAAEKLPELVAKLSEYAQSNSASLFDQNASIAGYIKSLEDTQKYVAGFYQKAGGSLSDLEAWSTQSVYQASSVAPATLPVSAIPAVDNSAMLNSLSSSSNTALLAEMRAMRAELAAAKAELQAMRSSADDTAANTRDMSRTLNEVTNGGEAMIVKEATA